MVSDELKRIESALARGQLSVPDETGLHHPISARCPQDGAASPVYRTEAMGGGGITRVVFRCPVCDRRFEVPKEEMFLR